MTTEGLIAAWRQIIVGDNKSWVLFEHGTCVVLMQPGDDLKAQAVILLKEWGPVHVGTPSADFNVAGLTDYDGWVVTCHHPDILTYVSPEETESVIEMLIGLLGRSKRDRDAGELNIIHIEDARGSGT